MAASTATKMLQQLQSEHKPTTTMSIAIVKQAMQEEINHAAGCPPPLHHWPTGMQQDNTINIAAIGNVTPSNTLYILLVPSLLYWID